MNKSHVIIVLGLFLVLILMSSAVSAANYTVNPGGSIQAAVNNASNDDTILVKANNGTAHTYKENVVINKRINLKSDTKVTIQSLNSSKPVFTVNSGGSGSIINGFNITGATNSSGIYMNHANNCVIENNSINRNLQGIYILQSSNSSVFNNTISNNTYGIFIPAQSSYDTNIISNSIIANDYGVFSIFQCFNMHLNRIIENNCSGLWCEGEESCEFFFNAENNWWGSNSPLYDWNAYNPNISYDMFYNGNLDPWYYEVILPAVTPWLILDVNVTPPTTNNNSIVTPDLTHNSNGVDTSSLGHIPNDIPVNFTTNLGTITTTAYMNNGKTNATFNRGTATSGVANITTTVDNQIAQANITIDTTPPTVIATPTGGAYFTTQSVTLTATDNLDPDPTIYYTLDGSTPTTSSMIYIDPISIGSSVLLSFMAVDMSGNIRMVQTLNYVIAPVINVNTNKGYHHIQNAIDDSSTQNGHTIAVSAGNYIENVVINKSLTLMCVTSNVTIQALNTSQPVFKVNSGGSGSVISGFSINGAIRGILLNHANNCTINSNNITNGGRGIIILNSDNCTINSNNINRNVCGLSFFSSNNNLVYQNRISNNNDIGIYLEGSNSNQVLENTITNNLYGLYFFESINNEIHFNQISGNQYGIYSELGSTINNAQNNWWSSNNPTISSNTPSDICIKDGTVTYNPWLVLNVDASTTNSGGYASVNADLTKNNQGEDTSTNGHIPDNLPVNFTTDFGTIITPTYTNKGKATTILNLGTTGSVDVNISGEFDGTIVYKEFTLSPGVAFLNITSSALDPSTLHYEFMGYQNVTETKVFNWYKLAVLLAGPGNADNVNGINALRNYLNDHGFGDIYIADMGYLPEAEVKELIIQHLYYFWWGDEALYDFVYYWGLPGSEYAHYIQQNFLSVELANELYTYMWDDVGNSIVQNPPSNDRDDTIWCARIWNARNSPSFNFSLMLPYVPISWTKNTTTTVPIYQPLYDTLNMTYEIPLDEPVKWVSIVWKDTQEVDGLFTGNLDLIVNGEVVESKHYFNIAYLFYQNAYREEVFNAIILANRLLRPEETDRIIPSENRSIWDIFRDILSEEEVQFVQNYRTLFMDVLSLTLSYPGENGKTINLLSSDGTQNLTLNFGGNPIQRTSTIIYGNGEYIHSQINPDTNTEEIIGELAGYEGVRSFAIATSKVTDDILQHWIEEKDRTDSNGNPLYPEGPMKAAYGTFLTALLMEYNHDMVADAAASKFNVIWSRTSPKIVSAGDEAYNYYLTLECDHGMGMSVVGDADNVKAFLFACSSAINPIEYWVMKSLFPNMDAYSSVTMGLGQLMLDGEPLEIYECNGYTVIKVVGDDTRIIIIDPETGIVRDILTSKDSGWINGAYCYSDQQAEWANDFGEIILSNVISFMNILENFDGIVDFGLLANNTKAGLSGFISSALISLESGAMFLVKDPLNLSPLQPLLGHNVVGLCLANAMIASEIAKNDDFTQYVAERKMYIPQDSILAVATITGVFGLATTPAWLLSIIFAPTIIGEAELFLAIRDHWLPQEYWHWVRDNPPFWRATTFTAYKKGTLYIERFQVPTRPNGELDWEHALYITALEGGREVDLTNPTVAAEINNNLDWGYNECPFPTC